MRMTAALLSCLYVLGTVQAGEGNTVDVVQENPHHSMPGHLLVVDQTEARNSRVSGLGPIDAGNLLETATTLLPRISGDLLSTVSALQRGSGHTATVTLGGDGGQVALFQDNSMSSGAGNHAQISTQGQALGVLYQSGSDHHARLTLHGSANALAQGLIAQEGLGLNASLHVAEGGTGEIIQQGAHSSASLDVATGTHASYTQIGNHLQNIGATGVQVFSTQPGMVSITQSGSAGLR